MLHGKHGCVSVFLQIFFKEIKEFFCIYIASPIKTLRVLADVKNTVDRESVVNFSAYFGLCLS